MRPVDWMIVGAYAVFTVGVGLLARRRVTSMSDYLVADRGVGLHLGVASLTGTELGVVTVMALAEYGFLHGFSAMTLGLCFFASVTFIGATGFIITGLRRHQVMTIPEYYGKRYHPAVRWLGGLILALAGILNMGVFLKVGAVFFTCIGGFDPTAVKWVMSGLLLFVLSTTLLGGMISVVFTDYFQYLFLVAGMLVATIFSVRAVGWEQMYGAVEGSYGAGGFNPFADADMGWPFIVLNLLVFMAVPAVWQPAASRALSARDVAIARKTTLWSGLTFMGRGTLPILWGIAALAYFHSSSKAPRDVSALAAMPTFLSEVLPAGVMGFFVAGMFAADMSTYNAYLLAWSSILTQDVVAPLFRDRLTDRRRLLINRLIIVLIGAFLLWWGLFYEPSATFIQYQQVTGTVYLSGAMACVVLGLYWKRATSLGAVAAIVIGAVIPIANVFLQARVDRLPSWLHFLASGWISGLLAFSLAPAAMILFSLLSRPPPTPPRENNP